ncbi:PD-(D/E)XK nuclease-like domain-containing protein [Oerskovia turbata]
MEPGIHYDIPEPEYHALPGLSSTGVKLMLDSPARYRHSLGRRVEKTAFDVGHAAHAKILGVGLGVIEYPDEHLTPSGNVSTKAATLAWASAQRENGLVPVAPDQARAVDAMAESVLTHPSARLLFEHGAPEVSLLWDDPETDVRCRGRIDYLHDSSLAVDLKTGRSADPRRFDRTAVDYGYAEQAVHYLNGLRATRGDEARFVHVLVENIAPYLVSVVELDGLFRFVAAARVRRAIDLYAACLAADEWPGYPADITPVSPPPWYGDDNDEEMVV